MWFISICGFLWWGVFMRLTKYLITIMEQSNYNASKFFFFFKEFLWIIMMLIQSNEGWKRIILFKKEKGQQ